VGISTVYQAKYLTKCCLELKITKINNIQIYVKKVFKKGDCGVGQPLNRSL